MIDHQILWKEGTGNDVKDVSRLQLIMSKSHLLILGFTEKNEMIFGNYYLLKELKYSEQILSIIRSHPLLQQNDVTVDVRVAEENILIVPEEFANEDLEVWYEKLHFRNFDESIITSHWEQHNACVVFCINTALYEYLNQYFSNITIQYLLPNNQGFDKAQVLIAGNIALIYVRDKKKLQYFQPFKFITAEDVVYFLHNALEQYAPDLQIDQVRLSIVMGEEQYDKDFTPYFSLIEEGDRKSQILKFIEKI